jgi:hypothetical protein
MPASKYEPRDARRGDEILASEYNRLRREVARLGRVQGVDGVQVRQGPGGPTISPNLADPWLHARVTGGDIDALGDTGTDEPGEGVVTLYQWDPINKKRTLSDETMTVYSDWPVVIPDETDVRLGYWEGDYWIEIINCPTPP